MRWYDVIPNAILPVIPNLSRYEAVKKKPPYAVWAEDDASGLKANNRTVERAFSGTLDFFTLKENDPLVQSIETALNGASCAWYLNSIQHEEETKYIHYEWVWSVCDS